MSDEYRCQCPRGLKTCEPLDLVSATDGGSFFCCGLNDGSDRVMDQDIFTVCFKNDDIDERSHWDDRDIITQVAVLSSALRVKSDIDLNEQMKEVMPSE